MDIVLLAKAAVMGIVEGLTEFLPISSTGHLILAGSLLDFDDDKAKVFDIAIQTGTIFAVILVYWQKIHATVAALPRQAKAQRLALSILIGFLPAVVLGLLFGKAIKAHLFTPAVVATTFILGGFVIRWTEKRPPGSVRVEHVDDMTSWDALKVGLMQCFAMIPGTSHSGATRRRLQPLQRARAAVAGRSAAVRRRAGVLLAPPRVMLAVSLERSLLERIRSRRRCLEFRDLASLHRVTPIRLLKPRRVARLACCGEADVGIAAERELLLNPGDPVLPKPTT